jgi:predicted NBD/HSP70 family sugar kinase
VIGGGVSNIGDLLLASIRQTVLNRSLPLSTRNLAVLFSAIGEDTGVTGAMTLAIDQAFSIERNSDSVRFEYEAKHAIWS